MRRHSRAWHDMHDAALAAMRAPAVVVLSPESRAAMVDALGSERCGTIMPMLTPGAPPQDELDLGGADRLSRHAERRLHYRQTGDVDE